MIKSIFTLYNPWILTNGSLGSILAFQEWNVLLVSIFILFFVSYKQRTTSVGEWIQMQHISVRWGIYLLVIITIYIFGTYGNAFHASSFIYGGF